MVHTSTRESTILTKTPTRLHVGNGEENRIVAYHNNNRDDNDSVHAASLSTDRSFGGVILTAKISVQVARSRYHVYIKWVVEITERVQGTLNIIWKKSYVMSKLFFFWKMNQITSNCLRLLFFVSNIVFIIDSHYLYLVLLRRIFLLIVENIIVIIFLCQLIVKEILKLGNRLKKQKYAVKMYYHHFVNYNLKYLELLVEKKDVNIKTSN